MAGAHGGKRPGAGKKKGTRAKKTVELLEAVASSGETPLEYMLRIMRDENADNSRRDDMAKAAASYVHSKMPTAIVTPPPPNGPVTDEDQRLLNLYLTGLHDEADES
jgi:hypothetical protein